MVKDSKFVNPKIQKKQGKSIMVDSKNNTEVKKTEKEVKNEEDVGVVKDSVSYKTIGEELKEARILKKISLEEISKELNIKVSQLEAIEKGDLEKLPEMIYAVGFIRNYAGYLSVDSKYAAEKFKGEHCVEAKKQRDFAFPEPLYENSVPGPAILGVGAFLSIIVLVTWIVYSSVGIKNTVGNDLDSDITMEVAEMRGDSSLSEEKIREPEFVETAPEVEEKEEVRTVAVTKKEVEAREQASGNAGKNSEVKIVEAANSGEDKLSPLKSPEAGSSAQINEIDVKVVETNSPKMDGVSLNASPVEERVQISSRAPAVMLKAKEASWIQVTDEDQKVIFRKVLRPGDEYIVPNQKGLSLVTANAGGLEVFVYGNKVQPIGTPGEIVRGISLNPDELKLNKIKARR